MVARAGFEPAISGLKGRRPGPLDERAVRANWARADSTDGRLGPTAPYDSAPVNTLDIVILAVIVLGVLFGYVRGLIKPLIPEAAVLGAAAVLYRHPELLHRLPALVTGPLAVFLVLVAVFIAAVILSGYVTGLVHLIPGLRTFDRMAGALVNGLVAFVLVYATLVALVSFDTVVQPINNATKLTVQQINALRTLVKRNPQFAWLIDDGQLQRMAQEAVQSPVAFGDIGYFDFTISAYEQQVRPQLIHSRVAPVILRLGQRLPIIGRPGLQAPAK